MTVARRRVLPPIVIGVLLVTLVPLVAAATTGRDDRSLPAVYVTALGAVGAIVAAGAVFLGWEVQRYSRLKHPAGTSDPAADSNPSRQPTDSG